MNHSMNKPKPTVLIPAHEISNLKKIDLAQFAINNYGYIKHKAGSTKTLTRLKRGAEFMVVTKEPRTGDEMYYTGSTTKRQNIYHLIKEEEGLDFRSAHKKYYNNSELNMPSTLKTTKADKEMDKKTRQQYLSKAPLTNYRYLNSRGITTATLKNEQFKDKIFQKEITLANGSKFANVAYPMYRVVERENKLNLQVYGLELDNYNYGGSAKHSIKAGSVWISNYDRSKAIDTITITEHPKDAISKWQLKDQYDQQNKLYISTFGAPTKENIETIKTILKHQPQAQLINALDNDHAGHQFNIKLRNELQQKGKEIENDFSIRPLNAGIGIELNHGTHSSTKDIERIKNRVGAINSRLASANAFKIEIKEAKGLTTVKISHPDTAANWQLSDKITAAFTGTKALKNDKSYLSDWNDDLMLNKGIKTDIDINQIKGILNNEAPKHINVSENVLSRLGAKLSPAISKEKGIELT